MGRKEINSLLIVFVVSVGLLVCNGCGGGGGSANLASSIPAVSGFTDSTGKLLDGAEDVAFNSLSLKFADAVDLALLQAPGAVAITCNGLPASVAQPTFTIRASDNDAADGIVGNEFTVDVADAYKYQLLSCTLTVGANVAAASNAKDAAAGQSVAFTNACAISSDFNLGDQETACWYLNTAYLGATSPWVKWYDDNLGAVGAVGSAVNFDLESGLLDWCPGCNEFFGVAPFAMGKSVDIGDADFEMIGHFKNISSIYYSAEGMPNLVSMTLSDSAGIVYFMGLIGMPNPLSVPADCAVACEDFKKDECRDCTSNYCQANKEDPLCGWGVSSKTFCIVLYMLPGSPGAEDMMSGSVAECPESEYYLKLSLSSANSTIGAYYSTDGQSWDPVALPMDTTGAMNALPLEYHSMTGLDKWVGIVLNQQAPESLRLSGEPLPSGSVDSLIITGATSGNQY